MSIVYYAWIGVREQFSLVTCVIDGRVELQTGSIGRRILLLVFIHENTSDKHTFTNYKGFQPLLKPDVRHSQSGRQRTIDLQDVTKVYGAAGRTVCVRRT